MLKTIFVWDLLKTQKCNIPEPFILDDINRTVVVVGGGVSGLTSAIESAKAGYNTVLIEKNKGLGGFANKLYKQLPSKYPYRYTESPSVNSLIDEANKIDNIKVMTNTSIKSVEGMTGNFTVTVNSNGDDSSFSAGSFVVSTGWRPYDANKLGHLGYSKFSNVMTNVEFEEMARTNNGKLSRPSDGKAIGSVLFVQCAGSRDENHLPYCSSVCCMTSLKQATYVREMDDNAKAYIIYKDMITPAQFENFYKQVQGDSGIYLTKGVVGEFKEEDDKTITVGVSETLIGEDIDIKVDLVVLATGMVPSEPDALQLKYRQGTEIPTLDDSGFLDSHYICFPYETRRTGIYAAGPIRNPMTMYNSMQDATGAALKAIQSIEMYSRGEAVHPRAGDQSHPILNVNVCTQCKRCTEECPFGSIDEIMEGEETPQLKVSTPKFNPNRCRRCGICFGACPVRALNFENYSMDMIGSMIKAIDVPDEDEEKPRILALMCENDAYPGLDILAMNRKTISPWVRVIPVRCLGSVNTIWIADALNSGIDGILLAGCKYGDDYQCHFIKGSEICSKRMENVQETLNNLMLESERVQQVEVTLGDYDRLDTIINDFAKVIEDVGPNPFKDF